MKTLKYTEQQIETIELARSLIRDLAHGWTVSELAERPENICERLSQLLGESYDFEAGEVIRK